jgi:hypothetical protein
LLRTFRKRKKIAAGNADTAFSRLVKSKKWGVRTLPPHPLSLTRVKRAINSTKSLQVFTEFSNQ